MPEQKQRFARDIRPDEHVNELFICQKKGEFVGKTGLPYLSLALLDKSGNVDAKVWDNVEKLNGLFQEGDYVRVRGVATQYNGKIQLRLSDIHRVADHDVSPGDFLPASSFDIPTMTNELRALLEENVTNPHLLALIRSFLDDPDFVRLYQRTPAAKAIHHSFVGGLIEHTLSVAHVAVLLGGHYPQLDLSMLLTGVFFHDLGKVRELDVAGALSYTDEGRLIGHITLGVEMMNAHIAALPDFPEREKMVLTHLVLSHHGTLEFGSPKRPKTLEALVLSAIDDLDARINSFSTILEEETQDGRWTNFQRIYDRYLYRWNGPDKQEKSKDAKAPAPSAEPKKTESFSNGIRLTLDAPDAAKSREQDKPKGGELPLFSKAEK